MPRSGDVRPSLTGDGSWALRSCREDRRKSDVASVTREGSLRATSRLSDLGRARLIGRAGFLALATSVAAVVVYNVGVRDLPGPLDPKMAQLWVLFLVFAVAELYVAGLDRGVRPIGVWSMSITLSKTSMPSSES